MNFKFTANRIKACPAKNSLRLQFFPVQQKEPNQASLLKYDRCITDEQCRQSLQQLTHFSAASHHHSSQGGARGADWEDNVLRLTMSSPKTRVAHARVLCEGGPGVNRAEAWFGAETD